MINTLTETARFDTLTLEQLRFAAQSSVARNVLEASEFRSYINHINDSLVFQLEAKVLAHKLADKTKDFDFNFEFPASNWHKFKLRKWPQWLIAHHLLRKVKYVRYNEKRTIEVRSWATFPETTIRYPNELGPIHVLQEVSVAAGPYRGKYDHKL